MTMETSEAKKREEEAMQANEEARMVEEEARRKAKEVGARKANALLVGTCLEG